MIECLICGRVCKNSVGLYIHASKSHGVNSQDYYHKYIIKSEEIPTCVEKSCDNLVNWNFTGIRYRTYCSNSCRARNTMNELWSTSEHRDSMSELHKDRALSEEHKLHISIARLGMKFSDSHKENMRKVRIGKKPTQETREKMSKSQSKALKKVVEEGRHNKFKSPNEDNPEDILTENGFYHPYYFYSNGRRVLMDYYNEKKLINIEIDGISHSYQGAKQIDEERDSFLYTFGVKVLRVSDDSLSSNLKSIERVLQDINASD